MSSSWDSGGDLTARNQTRPKMEGRYQRSVEPYSSIRGKKTAPIIKHGFAVGAKERQVIESLGHPYHLLGKVDFDIGGAWRSSRATVTGGKYLDITREIKSIPSTNDQLEQSSGLHYASTGAAALVSQALTSKEGEQAWLESKLPPASDLQMLRDGATAISRVAPTNPLVDLSTSLAELFREGLPSIPGRSGGLSSEYLNYQFGIAPIASDVRDMRAVISKADALWAQYAKNSGKGVRRKYTFPPEVTTVTTVGSGVPIGLTITSGSYDPINGNLVQPGTLSQVTTTSKRTWFSGSFTYYLPKESPFGVNLARLDKLYGLQPGVDTIYQLTPWSWLVDYFSNLGDLFENTNTFLTNGMVMPYGYIMSEKTITIDSRLDFKVWANGTWKPLAIGDQVQYVVQRRIAASPFGFGVNTSGLTQKQLSILVALGLSRR